MIYTIENEFLIAKFSSIGGELISVKDKNDTEFIWQGDKKYWGGHSPLLFPYCCRLYEGHYTYRGLRYDGEIHGFIRKRELRDIECGEDFIIFRLTSNTETKALYPFDFIYEFKYKLEKNTLVCALTVKNTGVEELYYCNGMHPGFNVPLDGKFEDWYLEFSEPAKPRRMLFSESKFCSGDEDFSASLESGVRVPLTHSLFDNEAIFLLDAAPAVSIRSDISEHFVRVEYPDSEVIGFWQPEFTDAPFICIEPLCGLPSFDGVIDDLKEKAFARRVDADACHTDTVKITFN